MLQCSSSASKEFWRCDDLPPMKAHTMRIKLDGLGTQHPETLAGDVPWRLVGFVETKGPQGNRIATYALPMDCSSTLQTM